GPRKTQWTLRRKLTGRARRLRRPGHMTGRRPGRPHNDDPPRTVTVSGGRTRGDTEDMFGGFPGCQKKEIDPGVEGVRWAGHRLHRQVGPVVRTGEGVGAEELQPPEGRVAPQGNPVLGAGQVYP